MLHGFQKPISPSTYPNFKIHFNSALGLPLDNSIVHNVLQLQKALVQVKAARCLEIWRGEEKGREEGKRERQREREHGGRNTIERGRG